MSIVFLRRPRLGRNSVKGMSLHLQSQGLDARGQLYNRRLTNFSENSSGLLVRWGCTAAVPEVFRHLKVINKAEPIYLVNNKLGFRQLLMNGRADLIPPTTTSMLGNLSISGLNFPMILRPRRHSQGRNLWRINNPVDLQETLSSNADILSDGWYLSELIDKKQEFRVYVVNGRVATVAEKHPDDPTQLAWNVHQGGEFRVVRWDDWNLDVCKVAIEAFNYSGLDFGGVDVMTDQDGRPYVIEINSAPSLPLLSDGSVSYRQKCMAKCFKFIHDNDNSTIDFVENQGWRGYIHPAVSEGAIT